MIRVFTTTLNSHGEHIHNVGQRVLHKLIKHVGGFVETSLEDCDVVFVGTPIMDPYEFNAALAERLNKPVMVFNESDGPRPESDVPQFSDWLHSYPDIRCYFFREWRRGERFPEFKFPFITFDLVDYLNPVTEKDEWMVPAQSREAFEKRPLDVFHNQSIHVASRKEFRKAALDKHNPRWELIDFYEERWPFAALMAVQGDSKITVTLEGAGVKCMRHYEGGINSVLCLHGFEMEETYPWVEGDNCLRLPYTKEGGEWNRGMIDIDKAIPYLEGWLKNPDLYNVYQRCVRNAARYSMDNYCTNHLAPQIRAHL